MMQRWCKGGGAEVVDGVEVVVVQRWCKLEVQLQRRCDSAEVVQTWWCRDGAKVVERWLCRGCGAEVQVQWCRGGAKVGQMQRCGR